MGLDMYLSKRVYVGAKFKHNKVKGVIKLESNGKPIKVDLKRVSEIIEEVGYWRKANQIHNWFVKNVQDGKDKCQESYVEHSQLLKLREACSKVLKTKDTSALASVSGFFFGSTAIDEYYFKDLQDTIDIINNLDPGCDYYYHASW